MKSSLITPVILCGGSGTRLWPLSRKSFPKQFAPLVGNKSLLQLTIERVTTFDSEIITVAAEDYRFIVADILSETQATGPIILEPAARNTAAAMALASLHLERSGNADRLLLFCPSDHHIPDGETFFQTIQKGILAAESGSIVTFGIVPSFPSTAYGYIQQGAKRPDGSYRVDCFIEKPSIDKVESLLLQGGVLWNAGIFLTRAKTLIDALRQHAPDILKTCEESLSKATSKPHASRYTFIRPNAVFSSCRSQSIDYAVMEPYGDVAVVPFNGQWSDVGSWNAVAALSAPDEQDNRIEGQGLVHNATSTFIHAPYRPVVALGTQDLLIIDTLDAVLVAHRQNAEEVKEVVAKLEQSQCVEAIMHRKVSRPWGWYDSVDAGERFQVKRIGVKPGASLSLQKHHHRAEHWVVVKGTAEVTRGNDVFLLSENQSTYIPVGEIHRLKNPGKVELEMIEVQSGSYLGEDDIVRLDDNYGRGDE